MSARPPSLSSGAEPALADLIGRPGATGIALAAAGAVYVTALIALVRMPGSDGWGDPLFLFGSLAVGFPALAWALTRQAAAQRIPAPTTTPVQLGGLLAYLAVFAAAVLGYGFSAINAAFADEQVRDVVKLAVKLITMVGLPWLLFAGIDARRRSTASTRSHLIALAVLGGAFTGFQCVVGRGLPSLSDLHPTAPLLAWAIPACLAWQVVEAGLCEEFLFRRILQERLAGATGSQFVAIAWSSLLFGLAHAPGLYLRGASLFEGVGAPTPMWAVAYSIAMIAPAGVAFGVVWARTRCLWLVVVLHGIVDLIPQAASFIETWHR